MTESFPRGSTTSAIVACPIPLRTLVPSVAELKLLRQLEVDLLERVALVLELYPELKDPAAPIDPLVREDLERLAAQHRRIGQLFKGFRQNLGLPDPNEN